MKEEIYAGLKNALERGIPMESAAQSFINAGYNSDEVRAAAEELSKNAASNIIYQPQPKKTEREIKNLPSLPKIAPQKTKERSKNKLILIISIAISLLILLGSAAYLIYAILK